MMVGLIIYVLIYLFIEALFPMISNEVNNNNKDMLDTSTNGVKHEIHLKTEKKTEIYQR